MTWLDDMRRISVLDVARRLGVPSNKRVVATCPACGVSRPLERSGKLVGHGNSGVGTVGTGGRCFRCGETFDAIDYLSMSLFGGRFSKRQLSATQLVELRQRCAQEFGVDPRERRVAARPRTIGTAQPPVANAQLFTEDESRDAPNYPPLDHVTYLFRAAWIRADECDATRAFLEKRSIDATRVADENLSCALKPGVELPPFARIGRKDWYRTGHRLLTPLFDAAGKTTSVIARCVFPCDAGLKSVAPRGHTRGGLVMANRIAQRVLAHGAHPSVWPPWPMADLPYDDSKPTWQADERLRLAIVEGETDFLSWCTAESEATEYPRGVMGIVSGSWRQILADRIPDNTRVIVATDLDDAGEKYARQIADTLRAAIRQGRALTAIRWRLKQDEARLG